MPKFLADFLAAVAAGSITTITRAVLLLVVCACLCIAALKSPYMVLIAVGCHCLRWAIGHAPGDPSPLPGDKQ